MSDDVSYSIVVQFLVQGFGSDEEFDRRVAIEELVGQALRADDNGENTGGDGGSGTLNAFFTVNDPVRGRETVLKALGDAGQLTDGLIVVHETHRESEDGDDTPEEEIWWPEDYPFSYTIFGPVWKGTPNEAALSKLSEGLRSLQGLWQVVRYDAPGGQDVSEWASALRFLIAGDRLVVRHQMSVVSAARLVVETPGRIDLWPSTGDNRGEVSLGVYDLQGEELQLCMVSPSEERPTKVAPKNQQQAGRMIMKREQAEGAK